MRLRTVPDAPHGAPCLSGCTDVHSYTADGVRWCWAGAQRGRHAIDAELVGVPPAALARHSVHDFWEEWTQLEVVAKLTDVPVLALFQRQGLGAPLPANITVVHQRHGQTHCCLGERHD